MTGSPYPFAPRRLAALGAAVAICAAATGCGSDDDEASNPAPATQASAKPDSVVRLSVVTRPGAIAFDKTVVRVPAGRVAFEFTNRQGVGHNVRVQTGSKCCFKAGAMDIGGTPTISGGETATAVIDLKPGEYVFLCSIGGHWQRGQRGRLVVS